MGETAERFVSLHAIHTPTPCDLRTFAVPFIHQRRPDLTFSTALAQVEVAGACSEHDAAKLQNFLAISMESVGDNEAPSDAVLAQDGRQATALWNLREGCPVALTDAGLICYKSSLCLLVIVFVAWLASMLLFVGTSAR